MRRYNAFAFHEFETSYIMTYKPKYNTFVFYKRENLLNAENILVEYKIKNNTQKYLDSLFTHISIPYQLLLF